MAAQGGIVIRDRRADFVKFGHDVQRVAQDNLPRFGGHHAATVPVTQPDAQFRLQQPDLPGQGGLGAMHLSAA